MANQVTIHLDRNSVGIVQQCRTQIKDVLQSKFECDVDIIGMGHGFGQPRNPPTTPERRYSIQLKSSEVFVWKADLSCFHVDAVVNAANERLDHCGGLAKALSVAGGPDIQIESNNYIASHGFLKTGRVFVGNAGRLPCKKIIHAVGPFLPYAPTPHEMSSAEVLLQEAVRNILKKAEEHKLKSVAIPALSAGLFNFPVNKCADIIVDELHKFDCRAHTTRYPCEIHLVNNDESTVKEMERACYQKWGRPTTPVSHGVQSQSNTRGAKTPQAQLTVQMGNVQLTVRKGYIEDQYTDVIVNTTGEKLSLSIGEISKAILNKAGKQMQEEILKKYSKGPKYPLPRVLQTKPHSLFCKEVYHTVCAPKSTDGAEQILYDAIQRCIQLAAKERHKSIAFPAIGTGHLSFTKKEVASIMTSAVENMARRMYTDTKMDVHFVIFPLEDDTFMAFEDKMRAFQGESSPGSNTGVSQGFDSSVAPQLRLNSVSNEANEEARKWLDDLLHCSGMATVNNNFIQYLGVEELRRLNRDTEPDTSIEEFFESGCAKIKIQAETSEGVIVHVLKAEAMLCAVQSEFVKDVMPHNPHMPVSERRQLAGDFKLADSKFIRQGLHVMKVVPIDNPALTEVFELKKKRLVSSASKIMYQRIPAQFCSMLKCIGFQREFAPPDDPKFGEGIYFASSIRSAMDLWGKQNHQDVYQYYIEAMVLMGNSTAGKRDLIMPPPIQNDPLIRYDSLTGGDDISVIFTGHQALPMHIFICQKRNYPN